MLLREPNRGAPFGTLDFSNDTNNPLDAQYGYANAALGIFRSQTPQGGPDWAGLMAATLVAALPMILLFLAFAKRITNSIGFSGIK